MKLKPEEETEIAGWIQSAVKNDKKIDKNAFFEDDASEIAAKHGLVLKRPPMGQKKTSAPAGKPQRERTPIVEHVETARQKPPAKEKQFTYEEGMIADAILGSESFRKAVVGIFMSNKKLIADLINESLRNLHIEVKTRE